jgi:hypothetical protein
MKILFVENRYKTYLWERIGQEYVQLGHEVHFIIQNHEFTPQNSSFKVHKIAYPSKNKSNLTSEEVQRYKKVIQSNRGLNYFGIRFNGFIAYYGIEIEKIIDKIQPDLALGEATLFHELLVIDSCKNNNILYLQPTSCRYPKNRFSFYKYETMEPYKGSGEVLLEKEAIKIANLIGKRKVLPDYMGKPLATPSKMELFFDKVKLIKGYYFGEKYNTPSPFYKIFLDRKFAMNIDNYESKANDKLPKNKGLKVLYPMQMQPESGIDVWGYPNNNQSQVIERIISALGDDDLIIIKPNPKSKYEIDNSLLNLIDNNRKKVYPLSHNIGMDLIWNEIDVVITVSGTVSIECIFDNKPILMFNNCLQTNQKNCVQINNDSDMSFYFSKIRNKTYPKLTENEKAVFINELTAKSYKGINGDGLHDLYYINERENYDNLKSAFLDILIYLQ